MSAYFNPATPPLSIRDYYERNLLDPDCSLTLAFNPPDETPSAHFVVRTIDETPSAHFVVRTIDDAWRDLFDPPSRADGRLTAILEARRRVCLYPDHDTAIVDRRTGEIIWRYDAGIPPQYEIVGLYAPDSGIDPEQIFSTHRDEHAAWDDFFRALEDTDAQTVLLRDTTPSRTVLATSDAAPFDAMYDDATARQVIR